MAGTSSTCCTLHATFIKNSQLPWGLWWTFSPISATWPPDFLHLIIPLASLSCVASHLYPSAVRGISCTNGKPKAASKMWDGHQHLDLLMKGSHVRPMLSVTIVGVKKTWHTFHHQKIMIIVNNSNKHYRTAANISMNQSTNRVFPAAFVCCSFPFLGPYLPKRHPCHLINKNDMDVLYFSFGHLPLCWRSLLLKTTCVELRNGGIFCCQVSSKKKTYVPSRCESTNAKKVSSLKSSKKPRWDIPCFPHFLPPKLRPHHKQQKTEAAVKFNSTHRYRGAMVTLLTCTTGPKASDWILSVTLVLTGVLG